jgi:cytochrome c2
MLRALMVAGLVLTLSSAVMAVDGKTVFEKKCKLCHSLNGEGGPKKDFGGSLDHVGAKHDEAWFQAYLKDPKSKMPDAKMPKLKLSDEDFNAVVKLLVEQK